MSIAKPNRSRRQQTRQRASLFGSALSSPQKTAQRPHYYGSPTDPSVDLLLHSSLTREQDSEIPEILHLRQELPSNLKRTSHPFLVENHGLRLGGADHHPSRFTLGCKPPQCML
ncbi:hypothetical protein XENOCAPTIV_020606 [Xenoophorus captivus]|uniref:Uncharacterized protein n=1 Tax=Xenoophorus captivus TaxID=1517983 RepID=A0ABV0SAX2_9TELE